jgi:hypothetical protein
MEKPSLQNKFTVLMSKFFPPKFPFQNTKEKIGGKNFLCKGTRSIKKGAFIGVSIICTAKKSGRDFLISFARCFLK